MHYYLGPWAWVDDADGARWQPPAGATSALDLRPTEACATTVLHPSNYGLFACPAPLVDAKYHLLGTDLKAELGPASLSAWKSALGIALLTSTTLLDVLWETLTTKADPLGADRSKPIMPCHDGAMELWFENKLVKARQFEGNADEAWPNIRAVLHEDYRKILVQAVLDATQVHRKVLGSWVAKYGVTTRELIPPDLPDVRPLPPETVITESFNKGDSDILGPDLSWTEINADFDIISNQAVSTAEVTGCARADTALSSDDQYVQANIYDVSDNNVIMARKDGTATLTHYAFLGFITSYCRIYKVVADSYTRLVTTEPPSVAIDSGSLLKGTVDGSALKLYVDGILEASTTDANISGNLYCGLGTYEAAVLADEGIFDNFEAGDLAAGPVEGTGSLAMTMAASGTGYMSITAAGSAALTMAIAAVTALASQTASGALAMVMSVVGSVGSVLGVWEAQGTVGGFDIAADVSGFDVSGTVGGFDIQGTVK